jgi:DNA-binding response OmpR family regulator
MAIKVLVVEDDAFLLKAYLAKLQNSDYEVQSATDGEEALAVMAKFSPDVVLLDLVMPRKDGFETLKEMRATEAYKNIPIFVISNTGQPEDEDRVMGLGATELLLKSNLSMSELVSKINKAAGK